MEILRFPQATRPQEVLVVPKVQMQSYQSLEQDELEENQQEVALT